MWRVVLLRWGPHVGDALEQVVFERTGTAGQLVGAAQRTAVSGPTLAGVVICKQTTRYKIGTRLLKCCVKGILYFCTIDYRFDAFS